MGSKNTSFKCALITGGGGGIGRAMAEYFIKRGKKVILVGRTESNLQSTAKEIGAAAHYVLDTGAVSEISSFIKRITADHPDLDCLVNNAGVQRPLEVLKQDPAEVLYKADQEIDINIRGPMHLAVGLLSHLQTKPHALIINVSSALGFVPFSIINPVYNGTKAWLHFWSMALRAQLQDTHVRVVEIAPPMVATDLHRERENPDDNKKEFAPQTLTTDEFMKEVVEKFEEGETTISAGIGAPIVAKWFETFGETYKKASGAREL
ncbi:short-chain dehydrogenase [Xylariomycetidae sp. FL2044]|nr:short-chain dehydrogenase [Xylariomycetidae sp. FL2044]